MFTCIKFFEGALRLIALRGSAEDGKARAGAFLGERG